MNAAEAQALFAQARDQVRARAVRGHPRRREGQGGAGGASRHGAHRWRGIRGLRALGLRHGAARPGLHGRRRSFDAHAHSLDAGLRAPRLQRHGQGQALSVLLARRAAAPARAARRARHDAVHGHRAGVHVAGRDASGKLGPFDATDTLDKPCYDYKGLSRASAVLDEITLSLAQRGHRRLPDRPRGRERPVRGELHLRGCAEVRRQLHLRENGGQRDRAQARHDRHLHAQAVLQPHGQRRALPHLASATTSTKNLFDDAATSAACSCRRWPITSSAACWRTRARWRRCARRR